MLYSMLQASERPAPGEVHVWIAPLDQPASVIVRCERLLSADELQRADRFRFPHLRDRFVLGRAALRILIARYIVLDAECVDFAYAEHGKPLLASGGLEFNASHSDSLFACAIASEAVGLDIEQIRQISDVDSLANRVMSSTELIQWTSLAEEDRLTKFFACWTRKESFLKATGEGISSELRDLTVGFDDAAPIDVSRQAPVHIRSFQPVPGYAGAVATFRKLEHVRVLDFAFTWEP
jgi:4'-phosphopantetheinyl transferase